MDNIYETIRYIFIGQVYTDTYENIGDGGPTCYKELTNEFRYTLSSISVAVNLFLVWLLYNYVCKSRECDLSLVKDVKPRLIEKIVGYSSYATYVIMLGYKIYTGRVVFMLNPCHMCLIMQSWLLTTKKTKFSALFFIQYLRWVFGPFFAFLFPNLGSYSLPLEVEFFYIEHFLAAIGGPVTLVLAGRYGFFKQNIGQWFAQQWWGFAFHSLFNRIVCLPISIYTWANVNFNLCKARDDPFLPLVGDYYLYWVDHYLNSASILCLVLVLLLAGIVKLTLKPFQLCFGKKTPKVKSI